MDIKIENTVQYQQVSDYLDQLKTTDNKGLLMPAMQYAQEVVGYLPKEIQILIAEKLGVTLSEVYGVATFYSQFSLEPTGKYKVGVCLGTACYVRGSGQIIERFEHELGIKRGETTADNNITLEATRCIGCCGLAPVFTVNDEVYGKATTDDVGKVIHKCRCHDNEG
jgi:NADH:ubiquinone oxidoreductase subunit E